jgi:2'-5' RNA ligase
VRLFVAVELPEEVRRAAVELAEAARPALPPASWVRPENLHLTLVFLGDADAARLPDLRRALGEACRGRRAFAAETAAPGAFPPRGPVRVLWLGLEPADALRALAEGLRAELDGAGFAFDRKPFRAHVTLARARSPWPAAARERIAALAPVPRRFDVAEAVLFESRLAPGGSRYSAQARLPLAEAA